MSTSCLLGSEFDIESCGRRSEVPWVADGVTSCGAFSEVVFVECVVDVLREQV